VLSVFYSRACPQSCPHTFSRARRKAFCEKPSRDNGTVLTIHPGVPAQWLFNGAPKTRDTEGRIMANTQTNDVSYAIYPSPFSVNGGGANIEVDVRLLSCPPASAQRDIRRPPIDLVAD
jgi:hypothetical protein